MPRSDPLISLDFVLMVGAQANSPLNIERAASLAQEFFGAEVTEGLVMLRFMSLVERGWLEKAGEGKMPETVRITAKGREAIYTACYRLRTISSVVIADLKEEENVLPTAQAS